MFLFSGTMMYLSKNKKLQRNDILIIITTLIIGQWVFALIALASSFPLNVQKNIPLPPINRQKPSYRISFSQKMIVTAYSSNPEQTDATPCLTANGFNLCKHNQENVVAANFLPFGTKIRIPELFGEKIFTVVDRMNVRYYYRVDVWMKDRASAKSFGAHFVSVEVLEENN